MKNMTLTHVSLFLTVLIALCLVYIGYENLDGRAFNKPLDKDAITYQTTKTVYHAGEVIEGTVTVCKNRAVSGEIQWNLIDTYLRQYPRRGVGITPQCFENKPIVIEQLPMEVYPDTYHFEGTLTYHINPFSDVDISLRTNDFQVVR